MLIAISQRLSLLPPQLQILIHARLASTTSHPYPFPTHPNPTPHQIFHLSPGAPQTDIKARYYDLVRRHHPDSPLCRDLPPEIRHARFQAITAAYDKLSGRSPMNAPFGTSDIYWDEVERRRQQHMRRQEYRRRYPHPDDAALNTEADDLWKDRILIGVGLASLFIGFVPGLWTLGTINDRRHLSASQNLAQARRDAREYGHERRREIRKRVQEHEGAKARTHDGKEKEFVE